MKRIIMPSDPESAKRIKLTQTLKRDWARSFWIALFGTLALLYAHQETGRFPLYVAAAFCLALAILSLWRERVWTKRLHKHSIAIEKEDDE